MTDGPVEAPDDDGPRHHDHEPAPPPRLGRRARFEAGAFHALLGTIAGGKHGYGGVLESHVRRQRDGSLPCPRCRSTGFEPLRSSADLGRCVGCRTVYSVHRPATLGEMFDVGGATNRSGSRPDPRRPPRRGGPW